jgi:DNA-binding NtrC family response regulator
MEIPLPPDSDLRRLVHFSAGDGRIWLAGHRMLLLHAEALGGLRRELMQTIGREPTRRVFMRTGYAAGQRDAALARQVRPNASVIDQFSVGPQLHMLEGAVQVTVETFEMDIEAGHHLCRVRWDHSWEVETHLRDFGPQDQPVCWMLIGYASGYVSAFMGRPVIYRETECCGCGHAHCRIEGRPVDAWPDGEQLARDYDADSMLVRIEDLQNKVDSLRSSLAPRDDTGDWVGLSRGMRRAIDLMRKAAGTQVTVMLSGEGGVGKERMARALHALSPRAAQPFVAFNAASVPPELVDVELFGAERVEPVVAGAHTGGLARVIGGPAAATAPAGGGRPGALERAHGGTLFLDDVAALPLPAQAKLLRCLQQGEVERVGATQARRIDIRVIAASSTDLEAAVNAGRLRRDLMYRLAVYPIVIPPLRERSADIEPLAQAVLRQFASLHHKRVPGFTDRALDAMRNYAWPGNVRELENLIERGVILATPGAAIDVEDLFTTPPGHATVTINAAGHLERHDPGGGAFFDEVQRRGLTLDALEDGLIREAVQRASGNLSAAARSLGIRRPQLAYRLQRAHDREA